MKFVLVDERISDSIERSLIRLGLSPIRLPKDKNLADAVASHPDTLLFHHGARLITTADYCDDAPYIFSDIREYCPDVKISFTADRRAKEYPRDCCMNALVIDESIYCNTRFVSEAIKEYAEERGLKIIHTNQGYPACTVLTFGNRAITSDRGMARLLASYGLRVLTISDGGIDLPPHEYGFIGGASLVYNNKVCFFGDVNTHPDGEAICDFIRDGGYEPFSLSTDRLMDFGGGIIL